MLKMIDKYGFEGLREPRECEFCGRTVCIDKRFLNRSAMLGLIALAKKSTVGGDYYLLSRHTVWSPADTEQIEKNPEATKTHWGEGYMLVRWGLAERGKAGEYRITQKGRDFFDGKVTVPAAGYFLNDKVKLVEWVKEEGEVTFNQALHHAFKLEELRSIGRWIGGLTVG